MLKKILFLLLLVLFLGSSLAIAADKININSATATELGELKGVGEKIAQRIIEYREKNGPFQKPDDILLVKGIGPKIMESNRDIITVGAPTEGVAIPKATPAAVKQDLPAAKKQP